MEIQWPKGINKDIFLTQYWQKKPLLIRQAFPDFDNPLDPNELAGLACEEEIPSRLIHHNSDESWTCEHGPFDESTLGKLPQSDWSLLISDIEKHLPDFVQYIEPFRFIPDWRIDDLMISYAPSGGSVGPHTDQYDVFLLQTSGTREWRFGDCPIEKEALIPDLDLKILRQFTASQSHTVHPGDLLYLPPAIPHYGISQDMQCMTWSFGFRAPSAAAMAESFGRFIADRTSDDALYRDPDLSPQSNPGEITAKALEQLITMLKNTINTDETVFAEWIGRFLTESGSSNTDENISTALTDTLQGHETVARCTQSRLAYISGEELCNLFANGRMYGSTRELAETICSHYHFSAELILKLAKDAGNRLLINELHRQNILFVEE